MKPKEKYQSLKKANPDLNEILLWGSGAGALILLIFIAIVS